MPQITQSQWEAVQRLYRATKVVASSPRLQSLICNRESGDPKAFEQVGKAVFSAESAFGFSRDFQQLKSPTVKKTMGDDQAKVLQVYPDAFDQKSGTTIEIWAHCADDHSNAVIGSGDTEEEAWEEAAHYANQTMRSMQ